MARSRQALRRLDRLMNVKPVRYDRELVARVLDLRFADRDRKVSVRYLALDEPVGFFVLEEQHRIRIVDRRVQQALDVGRKGRSDDL